MCALFLLGLTTTNAVTLNPQVPATETSWVYGLFALMTPFVVWWIRLKCARVQDRFLPLIAAMLPEIANLLLLFTVQLEGLHPGLGVAAGLLAVGLREITVKTVRGTVNKQVDSAEKAPGQQ
jgi:hypothetical protein